MQHNISMIVLDKQQRKIMRNIMISNSRIKYKLLLIKIINIGYVNND